MITYSQREVFKQTDMKYFEEASGLVARMPDFDNELRELRCHEVAQVVGCLLDLRVRDGKYEIGCEHSWLVLPTGNILDVYAVGRHPPVQLVAVVLTMPVRYREMDIGLKIRHQVVEQLLRDLR